MPWLSCIISNVILASLLALTACLVQRWPGRQAVARVLWVLVLVKLVTPPLVSVPLRDLPGTLACAIGACGCEQHALIKSNLIPHHLGYTLLWILPATWMIGAAATGWTAWRRWNHFRRLLAYATPAPAEWQSLAARLCAELSMRSPPQILCVPGRLPPLVVAGRHGPSMLLPMDLIGGLSDSQKEALLLHELVHIQRRDHLVRMLELTVRVAYWWLPVVGSIGRQLRSCEEACCDAAVLAHRPQARRDYAGLLLDVLDFVAPLPRQSVAQVTAMSAAHDLERRLRTILDATQGTGNVRPAVSFVTGALAMGLACAILPCNLHYDFVGRTAPAATSAKQEPITRELCPTEVDRKVDMSATMCCPS